MKLDIVGNIASWSGKRVDRDKVYEAVKDLGLAIHVPRPDKINNMQYILNSTGRYVAGYHPFDTIKCERKWSGRVPRVVGVWDIFGTTKSTYGDNKKELIATISYDTRLDEVKFYKNYDDSTNDVTASKGDPSNTSTLDSFLSYFPRCEAMYIDSISGGEVSKKKDMLEGWPDCIPLKDGGSMYWLPNSCKDRWLDIQEALSGIIPIQLFSQAGDANTLDGLFHSLDSAISVDIEKLESMVANGTQTEHQLDRQKALSEKLSHVVSSYQGVLGNRMDALVSRLEKAGALSVQANASAVSMLEDDAIFSDLPY